MEKCRWLIGVFRIGQWYCVQYSDASVSRLLSAAEAWRIVGAAILCIPRWTKGVRWGPFGVN